MQGVGDDEQAEEEHEDLLPPRQHRSPHRLCRLCHSLFYYRAYQCQLVKLKYNLLTKGVVKKKQRLFYSQARRKGRGHCQPPRLRP